MASHRWLQPWNNSLEVQPKFCQYFGVLRVNEWLRVLAGRAPLTQYAHTFQPFGSHGRPPSGVNSSAARARCGKFTAIACHVQCLQASLLSARPAHCSLSAANC
jgi:hypothetical protein